MEEDELLSKGLSLLLLISIAVMRFAPTLENGLVRMTFDVKTLDLGAFINL